MSVAGRHLDSTRSGRPDIRDLGLGGVIAFAGFGVFALWSFAEFVAEARGYRTGWAGFICMLVALAFLSWVNASIRNHRLVRARAEGEAQAQARTEQTREAMEESVQTCIDAATECKTTMEDGLRAVANAVDRQVETLAAQFNTEEGKQNVVAEQLRQRIELLEARCAGLEAERMAPSSIGSAEQQVSS